MKKKAWSIAITLPLIVVLGVASMLYTRHVSQTYREAVTRVEESARAGDMEAAQRILAEVADGWEKNARLLQLWVTHADTDKVSTHFKGLQTGLELGNEGLVFENTAFLMEALEHLHHRDDITWSNIL